MFRAAGLELGALSSSGVWGVLKFSSSARGILGLGFLCSKVKASRVSGLRFLFRV